MKRGCSEQGPAGRSCRLRIFLGSCREGFFSPLFSPKYSLLCAHTVDCHCPPSAVRGKPQPNPRRRPTWSRLVVGSSSANTPQSQQNASLRARRMTSEASTWQARRLVGQGGGGGPLNRATTGGGQLSQAGQAGTPFQRPETYVSTPVEDAIIMPVKKVL